MSIHEMRSLGIWVTFLRHAWHLMLLLLAVEMGWNPQPAMAQTTQPAQVGDVIEESGSPAPFDLMTRKRLTGDWLGLRSDLEDAGITFKLRYQSQYQQNFRGGLEVHNGHRISGSYDLSVDIDLEKLGLIEGGSFYFKAKGNHSAGINSSKVGGLDKVNADAVDDLPIYVRKWWYRQTFFDDKIDLRLGRYTSRKDAIDVGLYARHEDYDFLNYSSSRNKTIPQYNGIGAILTVRPVDWCYFTTAAVDAQAGRTRTGFDTAFHDDPRYIGYWEAGFTPRWSSAKGPMPGKYRFGWWYDGTSRTVFSSTVRQSGRDVSESETGDMGFYLGLDQMVYKERSDPEDKQGLGLFARYGRGPRDTRQVSDYWQIGASYMGLVPERDEDVFAFSVSQSILSSEYREYVDARADRETVYEWYYKWMVTPWFNVSPDFQVISNPGGGKDDRDAIVGGVRIQVIF